MKRLLLSFLLVLAGLGASGCSKTPPADDPAASEPVPIPLTKADESVRDASNAFGLDVFARLYALRGGRDVAFSPLSLSLALAMAAEGAENDSWAQFRSVCGWDAVTKDDLGAFYAKMTEGLVKADPQVHFIRAALSSVADTAIIPIQDYLGLGSEARINTPSTLGGLNWKWRLLPDQLTDDLAASIREMTRLYGRL